jgi:hypothetical protein
VADLLYHRRTLELLGPQVPHAPAAVDGLVRWAAENGVVLPAFSENQGNYDRLVVLDAGDDPPVLFGWCGRPPWVTFAQRFSDCVFAQVFDGQHLRVILDEHTSPGPLCLARMELRDASGLSLLRARFRELVTTALAVEGDHLAEHRFVTPSDERLNAIVRNGASVALRITGAPRAVEALEAELLEAFAASVRPPDFASVHGAASYLGQALQDGLRTRARFAFVEQPSGEVLDHLTTCHARRSLRLRSYDRPVDERQREVELGGADWGVVLRLRKAPGGYRWMISGAELGRGASPR